LSNIITSKIKIIYYDTKWEVQHRKFAKKYFNNRRRHIDPKYLFWKYRGPENKSSCTLLLATYNDKVIGQLGVIICQILMNAERYDACFICSLMLDNIYRGNGIAQLLYNKVLEEYDLVFGSNPNPIAWKSEKRFGFKKIMGPSQLFFPFYFSAITEKKIKLLTKILGWLPNPILLSKKNRGLNFDLDKYKINYHQINYDMLNKIAFKDKIYPNHNESYIKWRTEEFSTYQSKSHIFQKNNDFLVFLRYSGNVGFIEKIVYSNFQIIMKVVLSIIKKMQKRKVKEIKFLTCDEKLISYLKQVGFIKFRRSIEIIYCTNNKKFKNLINENTIFEYSLLDSDENI